MAVASASSIEWTGPRVDQELTLWTAAFVFVLALHIAILLIMIRMHGAPTGGEQIAPPAFEVSEMQMYQVVGDAQGDAETVTAGEATAKATEAAAYEPAEPTEEPMMPVSDVALVETTEAEVPPAEPPPPVPEVEQTAALQPVERMDQVVEDVSEPLPPAAVQPPAAEPTPTETTAPPPVAAEMVAPLQEELDPLAPLEAAAPEPLEPLESITPVSPTSEEIEPTPAEAAEGEVVETTEIPPLPRPRSEATAQEFQELLEEQRRVAEARAAEERRERAERRREERRERERAARNNDQGQARERPREQAQGGAAAGGGQASAEVGTGGVTAATYQDQVYRHLQRHKRYPAGESGGGTVTVAFTISASGSASGISIRRSSGNAALDQATLDMVRRASPFPPIPSGLGRSSMSFNVPVQYTRR